MNIFEQYGIKEVADVCLYAIELDKNDNEVYIPVLYMDTLKVSTVEESTSQSHAQGGQGNPKLITWDYGKDITITLEDALFTPASESMNWAGKLGAKGLRLSLRHFYDRNTDNNTPDTCLRTATFFVDKFSDFLIIPDQKIDIKRCDKKHKGYVGGTSIYCWLVDGKIVSDLNDKKRVVFKDLLLFYREQMQRWYFFNYPEYLRRFMKDKDTEKISIQNIKDLFFAAGEDTFSYVKDNLCNETIEPVALTTWEDYFPEEYEEEISENKLWFLTQNVYIDGYRNGCDKTLKYSDITEGEQEQIINKKYLPYRYFANVGVEYNTNIVPPQDVIYQIETAHKNIALIERFEKLKAKKTFCIDADMNIRHNNYRYLYEYDETELKVFIDPKTMMPYQSNAFEFYRTNGQRITGNLRIIEKGENYYKWTRQRAEEHDALGRQIIIDPIHFPGTYRLVGETSRRDRYGNDQRYQFEIPLCKMHPENKFTLEADGDPTVFTMKLTALRRNDGVMMKLTSYDLLEKEIGNEIKPFNSPNPILDPQPHAKHPEVEIKTDWKIGAISPRDVAMRINAKEAEGFYKSKEEVGKDTAQERSRISVKVSGDLNINQYSIDETIQETITENITTEGVFDDVELIIKEGE